MTTENLEPGTYYQINNTKKVLYWEGDEWMKPEKDHYKRFTLLSRLEKQPTNVKTVIPVEETEFAWQYKSIMDR